MNCFDTSTPISSGNIKRGERISFLIASLSLVIDATFQSGSLGSLFSSSLPLNTQAPCNTVIRTPNCSITSHSSVVN